MDEAPAPLPHPLTRPGWVAFALVVLAIPLGAMWSAEPSTPAPFLTRLPAQGLLHTEGRPASLRDGRNRLLVVTDKTCASRCQEWLTALHDEPNIALLFVAGQPSLHDALASVWTLQPADDVALADLRERLQPLPLVAPFPWLLLVDGSGAVRGAWSDGPTSLQDAREALHHLPSIAAPYENAL